MGIDNFISNFKGGARANRFRIIITWPGIVGAPNVADEIVVHSASLPASNRGVVQAPYMGLMIPIPGDTTYDDWTIMVLNDTTFSHRNAFERWEQKILSAEGNVQAASDYRQMVTTITIQQLDRQDNVIKTVLLHNAWPHNVGQIDLGYQNNDQIEEYNVSLHYTHWTSADTPTT